ncbi:hypothetical protein HPB48_019545 [Haemaphysalis longicornis]|uniref:Uncharacterized protein n=1 Tax=Haemaphysalis longicornis TaxID=44386 RepID=A0A9J6GKJ0_HAELO|nr:hypothetical protein HPB48_019545 [Haemaphysalis longicornis]
MPQSWEHAMLYRQLLVAESREVQEQASDLAKVDDGSPPSGIAAEMPGKGPKHNNRRRRTTSRSSMSRMGAHLVLAFDCRKLSDSSAEGRHGTSTDYRQEDRLEAKPF